MLPCCSGVPKGPDRASGDSARPASERQQRVTHQRHQRHERRQRHHIGKEVHHAPRGCAGTLLVDDNQEAPVAVGGNLERTGGLFLLVKHEHHMEVVGLRDVQLVADDVGDLCGGFGQRAFQPRHALVIQRLNASHRHQAELHVV